MDPKICLILLGIAAFTNGRPSRSESSYLVNNEHELQQLLKTLYRGGKVDLTLSHHEDSPNKHHVDSAYITHHDEYSHSRHSPSAEEHVSHPQKEQHYMYHNDAGNRESINLGNLVSKIKGNTRPHISNNNDAYILLGLDKLNTDKNKDNEDAGILDFLKTLDENVENISSRQNKGQSGKNRDDKQRSINYLDVDVNYDEINKNDNDDDGANNNYNVIEKIYRNDDDDDRDDRNDNERQRYDNDDRSADSDTSVERGRSDDRDDDDNNGDGIESVDLRERRLPDGDAHIQQQFSQAKKFKINDELDAIVLDMSDLNKSLGKSSSSDRNNNKQTQVKYIEDAELNDLVNRDNLDSEPLEAIVVDLTNAQNDLTNQINNLVKNLEKSSKSHKSSYSNVNSNYDTRILSHNEDNNNVYVPQWLLDEVVSKAAQTNLKNIRKEYLRSLLPLTAKQKQKLIKTIQDKKSKKIKRSRRSIGEDVGVPFHLDIQGLGQVNA